MLKDDRIETFSQLFSASYEKRDVSTNVPWHVVEECNAVVDMNPLCLKMIKLWTVGTGFCQKHT